CARWTTPEPLGCSPGARAGGALFHALTCDSLRRTRAGGRPPSALRAEGNRRMGMTNRRIRMLGARAAAAALALTAAPAAVAAPMAPGATFTCETGDIPSGTYGSLTVAGLCGVEDGASILVTGSVTVTSGAMLNVDDAASFTVAKNVTAMEHSLLLLGDDL